MLNGKCNLGLGKRQDAGGCGVWRSVDTEKGGQKTVEAFERMEEIEGIATA